MSLSQTEKVAGRCWNCNRQSTELDRFCRRCGFNQSRGEFSSTAPECHPSQTTVLSYSDQLLPNETTVLAYIEARQTGKTTALGRDEDGPQSLSRLPLDKLSQSVAVKTAELRFNRFGALVIAMLIAIPMWLLIVILSPFDAYLSAKAAWSQMNVR